MKLVEDPIAMQQDRGGRSVYGNASVYGGATVYDGVKTPMHGKNTPSYYPQSQWGGGQDYDNEGGNSNFVPKTGSEHYSSQFYSAHQSVADSFMKKEASGWGDEN